VLLSCKIDGTSASDLLHRESARQVARLETLPTGKRPKHTLGDQCTGRVYPIIACDEGSMFASKSGTRMNIQVAYMNILVAYV
jgi:hypothetical protein